MSAKIWQMRKAPNGYATREERRRWRNSKRRCMTYPGCMLVRGHRPAGLHFVRRTGPVIPS